jgi:hypothetical protein
MDDLIDAWLGMAATSLRLDAVVAKQQKDPRDDADDPPAASRVVDDVGTRTADGNVPAELCAVLSGHADVSSRRSRGHVFLPPVLDSDQMTDFSEFTSSGTYITAINSFVTQLEKLLYTAGGSHASGGAEDWDLATFSRVGTVEGGPSGPSVYARWASVQIKRRVHFLRSRGPHL